MISFISAIKFVLYPICCIAIKHDENMNSYRILIYHLSFFTVYIFL